MKPPPPPPSFFSDNAASRGARPARKMSLRGATAGGPSSSGTSQIRRHSIRIGTDDSKEAATAAADGGSGGAGEIQTEDDKGVPAGAPTTAVNTHTELINTDELLRDYSWKINSDAAALEGKLQADLLRLESENVHGLIESRAQTRLVCEQVDCALRSLDEMQAWIQGYLSTLTAITGQINYIGEQNRLLLTQAENRRSLTSALERLMSSLTLPPETEDALLRARLDDFDSLRATEMAAARLDAARATQLDPDFCDMQVVREQAGRLATTSASFAKRVLGVCIEILLVGADECLAKTTRRSSKTFFRLLPLSDIEIQLVKLKTLLFWQRKVDEKAFNNVINQYSVHVGRVLRLEIKELMEISSSLIPQKHIENQECFFASVHGVDSAGAASSTSGSTAASSGTKEASQLSPTSPIPNSDSATHYLISLVRKYAARPGTKSSEQLSFVSAFSQLLHLVVPAIQRQHTFASLLFGYGTLEVIVPPDTSPVSSPERKRRLQSKEKVTVDTRTAQGNIVTRPLPEGADWYAAMDSTETRLKLKNPDAIRNLLNVLFSTLVADITDLLENGIRDSGIAILILNTVERMFQQVSPNQTFILDLLSVLQNKLRGHWARFILIQQKAIQESHLNRKKSAILPFVRGTPIFVEYMEHCIIDSPPDSIALLVGNGIDSVIKSVVDALDQLADDEAAILENSYVLHEKLKRFKTPALQDHIAKVAALSNRRMDKYLAYLIRKAFTRLHEFFSVIENLIVTQTPEEIAYQLNYNKAAAKRILTQYNQKEISRCFEYAFRKINKLLHEQQVIDHVWARFFKEFEKLNSSIVEIVKTVYQNEMTVEFSLEETRNSFRSIGTSSSSNNVV